MFIPDSLRNYMIEPDVSNYLQAPSSSQVCDIYYSLLLIFLYNLFQNNRIKVPINVYIYMYII